MPDYWEPTAEELEESRDVRIARQQLERLEIAVHYLDQAAGLWAGTKHPDDVALKQFIKKARAECLRLEAKCSGRIASRRRPLNKLPTKTCTVFVDECGQHALAGDDTFPVFVLAAVIIRDEDYGSVEEAWKRWKLDTLGMDAIIHEPDLRRRNKAFRSDAGEAAIVALPNTLEGLPFTALAVAVHRPNYVSDFGTGPIDESLPEHVYMLALDFLIERIVLALDRVFNGARALIVAESRGAKENALLQHEFARLHLEGTSYIAPGWFQQQLHPGIQFLAKTDNNTGLQLADLFARPIGEKVIDPTSDPVRWQVFRKKLCGGQQTKNSPLGLKIMPWRDEYEGLWKS